jgi:Flp pilus assembly pilin Flp
MFAYLSHISRNLLKLVQTRALRSDQSERNERGQASVEYALVLLAAAVIATVLISWATNTNVLNSLFDFVVTTIQGKVK